MDLFQLPMITLPRLDKCPHRKDHWQHTAHCVKNIISTSISLWTNCLIPFYWRGDVKLTNSTCLTKDFRILVCQISITFATSTTYCLANIHKGINSLLLIQQPYHNLSWPLLFLPLILVLSIQWIPSLFSCKGLDICALCVVRSMIMLMVP
jgi:hypothetical protein